MTTFTEMPSLDALRAIYQIDPKSPSGLSRVKATRGRNGKVGPVLSIGSDGYYRMKFDGKFYRTHRVIYFMHTGIAPAEHIVDHIDGDRLNNKIENLRLCNVQENLWNSKRKSNKSDGLPKGIRKYGDGFAVNISVANEEPGLVIFQNLRAASQYADQIRKRYHGEFARSS